MQAAVADAAALFGLQGLGHAMGQLVALGLSIRAMLHAHAPELAAMGTYRATVEDIPSGARLTVTAADPQDRATVAKIRGLGFMGLLTLGNHHAPHHMALARGAAMSHR